MNLFASGVNRFLREPPFRLLAKCAARYLPCSLETKVQWEALSRPQYAAGVLFAARQARQLGLPSIGMIEFGVARGAGLLALQTYAELAAREFDLEIDVYGFDLGDGLPDSSDYRDHPDAWRAGDYPMGDVEALRSRLLPRTHLVLGDVATTVPEFVRNQRCPVGFVSIDLDLYSSTRNALRLFTVAGHNTLPHTPLYFDDTLLPFNHRFAGELLAIDEFNVESGEVKIDLWRSLVAETAFPESPWLQAMYLAHDLAAAPKEGSAVNLL
jgi:hypothetical protein